MSHFYQLKVAEVQRLTNDSVVLSFEIPAGESAQFSYKAGQYVTLRAQINGKEVRRSYSLCSAPSESGFKIGVKEVQGGNMSVWLNRNVKAGDVIDVMPPAGNFKLPDNISGGHFVAYAAGSGITPVLSMMKECMEKHPEVNFTLFYGNKSMDSVMFKSELHALNEKYSQLHIYYVLSRETASSPALEGRMSGAKALDLLRQYVPGVVNEFFLCGPGDMIVSVADSLKSSGISEKNIHFELFSTPVQDTEKKTLAYSGTSSVEVVMDGMSYHFSLAGAGNSILDAAISAGVDAPFSCKGAVCCTCKAKILEGTAAMDMNYALTDSEVADGYILTCQAHPTSEKLKVDYDVI